MGGFGTMTDFGMTVAGFVTDTITCSLQILIH